MIDEVDCVDTLLVYGYTGGELVLYWVRFQVRFISVNLRGTKAEHDSTLTTRRNEIENDTINKEKASDIIIQTDDNENLNIKSNNSYLHDNAD